MAHKSASKHCRKSTNDLYDEISDSGSRFKSMYSAAFVDHSSRKRNEGIGRYEKGQTTFKKSLRDARSPDLGGTQTSEGLRADKKTSMA